MKKAICRVLPLIAFISFARTSSGQDYFIESTYLGTKTKAELFLIFFQQVNYDVNLYKLTYETIGVDGLPDTASGLIVVPVIPAGTPLPIVMYEHGTTSGPTDVPSQLRGGYEGGMAYAAMGFLTFAPDYLGLGDSRGFHPYVHAATESSASLDMLNASVEWLEFNAATQPSWDLNHLFITGYSQGGHASMALHHDLENFWGFVYPVTATTHMSGPYSISGVMRDLILGDNNYGDPAYIAYIALGYQSAYGNLFSSVDQVFIEPYASDIDSFYQGIITLGTLNGRLLADLGAGGNTYPKRMFQDSLLNGVISNPNHPFNVAMADNDTYAWAPSAPTRLYYCSGDEQVPYLNSLVADTAMQNLGATDVEAIDLGPALDHSFCAIPAFLNSIQFFLSFLDPAGIWDQNQSFTTISIHPNPVVDEAIVDWPEAEQSLTYEIYNSQGQPVQHGWTSSLRFETENLISGLYVVILSDGTETRVARFARL